MNVIIHYFFLKKIVNFPNTTLEYRTSGILKIGKRIPFQVLNVRVSAVKMTSVVLTYIWDRHIGPCCR